MHHLRIRDRILSFDYPNKDREVRGKNTPYWEEFVKGKMNSDFKRRFRYQCAIADKYGKDIHSYLEPMAGVGITASMFSGMPVLDERRVRLNDFDSHCYQSLKKNFSQADVSNDDVMDMELWGEYNMCFLDYNNFTYSRFCKDDFGVRSILDKCICHTNRLIVINDSTLFHLRYKADTSGWLGIDIKGDAEMYVYLFRDMFQSYYQGWHLVESFMFHSMAYHVLEYNAKEKKLLLTKDVPITFEDEFKLIQ